MTALSFDDPKPAPDTRRQQFIFLRPSIKAEIDKVRGKMSRSEWIKRAVLRELRRDMS